MSHHEALLGDGEKEDGHRWDGGEEEVHAQGKKVAHRWQEEEAHPRQEEEAHPPL
jgi:hypothetical protein